MTFFGTRTCVFIFSLSKHVSRCNRSLVWEKRSKTLSPYWRRLMDHLLCKIFLRFQPTYLLFTSTVVAITWPYLEYLIRNSFFLSPPLSRYSMYYFVQSRSITHQIGSLEIVCVQWLDLKPMCQYLTGDSPNLTDIPSV